MDKTAFYEAVDKYRASVFRIAYNHTGSFEDSEDISQEVFLKLFEKNKSFSDGEHMKAWLIRVTINAAKSKLRRSSRRQRSDSEVDRVNSPYYSDVESRELFDCVMRLPPKYRMVVYL